MNRRDFLKTSTLTAASVAVPMIIPASVRGATAPSNRITFGFIGVGRMGGGDLGEILGAREAQVVAVCDLDANRVAAAQARVDARYAAERSSGAYKGCTAHGDYRELVARDDIDAVSIATPDHWHALPVVAAARAGKDIFLQKPMSLTIAEGRVMSDTVRRYGRVFQIGSQQRSDARFRQACELVRNGRIGKLQTITVAFGIDPGTTPRATMPVPPQLNYEMWLGPAPWAPYTEDRVHPQKGYGRPGWLRIQDYGAGMITGWGSHHLDIMQWGMGTEHTGPVTVEGRTEFPKDGLWDVHGKFHIEYTYANGVKVLCTDDETNPHGIRFTGTDGWVHVLRGSIDANPKSLLESTVKPDEINLYKSSSHKGNLLECIRSRAETIAPVEIAHRSCSVCLLGQIAMQLGRRLQWNPDTEQFVTDDEANRLVSKPMTSPWHL